jgi:hypothetical protein
VDHLRLSTHPFQKRFDDVHGGRSAASDTRCETRRTGLVRHVVLRRIASHLNHFRRLWMVDVGRVEGRLRPSESAVSHHRSHSTHDSSNRQTFAVPAACPQKHT